ncbi:2S seed storage albumin protein-like [Bidens hawaiensis]|uniref:2S seed storage albumin protein-like n=1 Tax=Bidens hawaiensis TaxID=980011 RepID=UPI00404A359C
MAKHAFFALTFMAIIAFSVVSAYKTTIVTTIIEGNKWTWPNNGLDNGRGYIDGFGLDNGQGLVDGLDNPTSSQIPIEQLNHCKMHLTQGIIFDKMAVRPFKHHQEQHLQQCCSQLKQVFEQCQCDAIQQVFSKAWQQKGGLHMVSEIASKAYKLPSDCGLKLHDCRLAVPRV